MLFLTALLLAAAAPAPDAKVATPATAATKPDPDSPEAIAADSARDLQDNRYYNKPGATRAEYDADWQECRLIARGSRTPAGSPVVVYNPAIISPAAAAGGGIIGAMIGQAIVEGQLRRANRRECLMFKGWRLVKVADEDIARFAALPDAEREAIFNQALGAADPKGEITVWQNSFADPPFLKNAMTATPATSLELAK
jgi:hypothetical protein